MLYKALSIINWESAVVEGKEVLVMVVLREWTRVTDTDDVFDQKQEYQYRVLTIEDGVYHHRLYNKSLELVSETTPMSDNKTMGYIPFVIHGGIEVQPVFLGEILDLNLHHFQLSADQFHGLHFCGLPTPWVSGVDKNKAPTCIGPTKFVVLEEAESEIGLLEFQGQGMQPIADKLSDIERTITAISVSSMERSGRVTATQANIDFANDTASLAGVVNSLSAGFTEALMFASKWMQSQIVVAKFTTDFVSGKMPAQELLALTQAYLSGSISFATYWNNLVQGEIADPNKTAEEEQAEIEIDPDPDPEKGGDIVNVDDDTTPNPK